MPCAASSQGEGPLFAGLATHNYNYFQPPLTCQPLQGLPEYPCLEGQELSHSGLAVSCIAADLSVTAKSGTLTFELGSHLLPHSAAVWPQTPRF